MSWLLAMARRRERCSQGVQRPKGSTTRFSMARTNSAIGRSNGGAFSWGPTNQQSPASHKSANGPIHSTHSLLLPHSRRRPTTSWSRRRTHGVTQSLRMRYRHRTPTSQSRSPTPAMRWESTGSPRTRCCVQRVHASIFVLSCNREAWGCWGGVGSGSCVDDSFPTLRPTSWPAC